MRKFYFLLIFIFGLEFLNQYDSMEVFTNRYFLSEENNEDFDSGRSVIYLILLNKLFSSIMNLFFGFGIGAIFIQGEYSVVESAHNTFLDVPLSCPFMPSGNVTIAKKSFAKVPIFGWFYKRGSVLVDRNSDKSRRESFEQMKKVLAAGLHMGIYPEGTRNRSNEPIKKFYDGAFKLAVDSGKKVLPCVMYNTAKALPTDKFFWLMPTKLYMQFLPAISSTGKTSEQLRTEVFEIMVNEFVHNKP